ncbi:MAG TPA: hypothetical protein VLH75_20570 [Longimicrobiales bacterium]|nr:hypothetical protein [Longimicrobiales bacterium]
MKSWNLFPGPGRGELDGPSALYADRLEFLGAVADVVPEAVEELRRAVSSAEDVAGIMAWAERRHLTESWTIHVAISSVEAWAEKASWPTRFLWTHKVTAENVQEVLDQVARPIPDLPDCLPPFDPYRETAAEFKARVRVHMEGIEAAVAARGAARRHRLNRKGGEHPHRFFVWLAECQVGGLSFNACAALHRLGRYNAEKHEWSGSRWVRDGVRTAAELIGLELRQALRA